MPSIISGAIGETDVYSIAQNKRDVGLKIALLDPASAPLTLLSQTGMDPRNVADVSKANLAKMESGDPKIEWYEDALIPSSDAVNKSTGYAAGDTSIVVDNAAYWEQYGYAFVKRTGEILYATTVTTATNTLTVTRGALGTTAAAINDNDELIILDPSREENAAVPTSRSTLKSAVYNYLENIRTPIAMGGTTMNTKFLGEEKDWPYQTKKAGIQHAEKIEMKFLFGGRAIDRTGTETKWSTGGLATMITTNVYDAGGTLSRENFDRYLAEPAFKRGRGAPYRILLASPRLNSVICGWGNSYVRLSVNDKKFGLQVNEYVSPHGSIYVVPHHLLYGVQGPCGFLVDPTRLKYRYMANRDTQLKQDVVKTGVDGRTDEYLAQVGLEIRNESTMAIIKNVVA